MDRPKLLRSRLQRPVFWGSLLLNVVVIGLLLVGPGQKVRSGPPKAENLLQHMGAELTGQDKEIFDRLLSQHASAFQQQEQEMFAALQVIIAEVKKQPFDPQALQQAHVQLNARKTVMDQKIGAFVMEMATSLSPEGRQRLKLAPPHMKHSVKK